MKKPIIEFRDVYKSYGNKVVLNGVNLKIYEGEVTTIIGKSGVGKSVSLKLMIGLDRPDKGDILFRGESILSMPKKRWKEVKKEINFMFQNNALFDSLTIFENIALPLRETTKLSNKEISEKVMRIMETLDIQGHEKKYPSQLSGGMQKRVALARALVTDPKMVLFDEPTAGLDPVRRNNVLEMITTKQKEFGFTAVLVTHDVPHVFYISNRVAIIDSGKFIFEGSPRELEFNDHPVVHEFINSLEFLKNDVSGMMTRRDFEKFFTSIIEKDEPKDFDLVVYEIDKYSELVEKVGHITPFYIFQDLVSLCKSSCGEKILGFGKYGPDKIVSIIDNKNFNIEEQICAIQKNIKGKNFKYYKKSNICVEFSIYVGFTRINREKTIIELVEDALKNKILLSKLTCN